MKTLILATEKEWHKDLFENLKQTHKDFRWILINDKNDFNLSTLNRYNPDKIFLPHWSYIISKEIYTSFECVVFHMTDLPFGRGGSPLQNLIARGFNETKISALKVDSGIDTGDIYLKQDLSLHGTAQEIFIRSSEIIEKMIDTLVLKNLKPIMQTGEVTYFERRKPSDGDLSKIIEIDELYDLIRMLDADGYPKAFIELGEFKFEFSRVNKLSNKSLIADVRITKK